MPKVEDSKFIAKPHLTESNYEDSPNNNNINNDSLNQSTYEQVTLLPKEANDSFIVFDETKELASPDTQTTNINQTNEEIFDQGITTNSSDSNQKETLLKENLTEKSKFFLNHNHFSKSKFIFRILFQ